MKAKLSKKLLSAFLALMLVVTSAPLSAISAFAADSNAISVKNGVTTYLTENVTDGVETNYNDAVVWDEDERAAYFDGTGYLELEGTPLSGASSEDGFAISFDVKRSSSNGDNGRIIDVANATGTDSFAINGGTESENSWRRYMTLALVDGTEYSYYTSDFTSTSYCTYTSTNLTDETTADTWINITVTVDPDGYYSYYVDGVLRATYDIGLYTKSDTTYYADHTEAGATFGDSVAEASIYYIGRSIYPADPYFQGYIRNVKFCDSYASAADIFANSANSDDSIDKLAGAIAQYETFMDSALADSVTFDGIADSYDKYVLACEAYDAYYYGGNTDVDVAAAAEDLALATIPMMESKGYYDTPNYVPDTAFANDSTYDNQYDLYDPNYDSLLYVTNSASSYYTGSINDRLTARIVVPAYVVAFYDGETTPRFGAMPGYSSNSGSYTRGSSCFYVTDSSASVRPDSDWYYRSATNYDYSWTLADPTGTVPYYLSTTDTSASVKANAYRYMAGNLAIYPEFGETDGYVQMGSVEFTCRNYDSELYATTTADFSGVYVLNYAGYKTALDGTFAALDGISVSDYKEGGLADMMALLQSAADVNFDTDFSSDTATTAAAVGTEITEFLTAYAAGIPTMTADDAYAYLRGETNGFEYSGTIPAFVTAGDETVYSVIGAYNNGTRKGFSADSYEAFVEAYKAAQAVMYPVYTNGYYTDYTAAEVEAAADALIAAFLALEPVSVVAPSVTDSCLLGPSDGFVITTNDTDDSAVTYYTLTYSDGTTVGETVATSGETIYPFESIECNTVTVTAYTALGDDDSKTVTAAYTYYYAPTISVSDGAVISGTYPVTISSNNTEANAGTLQYSYDGTNWYEYTAKFAPFSADEIAVREALGLDNADTTCTIYAREVNGSATSGTATASNLIRRATFGIYSDSQYGSEYIDSSATITIADVSTYTGSITYVLTIDGTTVLTGTYDKSTGIVVADISQLASANVVEVKAYATSQGSIDQYATATFYNHDNYTPLAYQESFTDASISDTTFTTGTDNGIDGVVTSADLFQVVDGAGILDSNGNSTSWRNNVLYVSSSDTNSALALSENPLSSGTAQTVAQETGATITFWRYVSDSSGNNSYGYAIFDEDWLECLTFETETSTSANPDYFTVSATAQISRNDDETNKLDITPEEQGVTEHEVGNNSCYWVQVAVVIDPDEGVKIYTNGQEHEVATLDVKGTIKDNNADAAAEILSFLTSSDSKLSLGAAQNNTITASYYLDDVRIYSTALTQTDINNMYNDDDADIDSSSSTGHDPTAVTVYTLNDGSQVGQTYFDKIYSETGSYDYSDVVDTDYYIFGTGMTVYHFNDTTVKWEVIGDSEGRCGYQDEDLFGDVYTTALAEPLAHAAQDSANAGAGKLVWAPHVMYNVNSGLWCYYGSTSSWGSGTSAIFLCTSDSPTGPYEYQCIVTSTTTGSPNTIDPCVYYDADFTQLYMVYGSWGGENCIYCKKLYANGTPILDGQGSVICYGINTTLESGSSDGGSGEGAFVEYNYDTGYYYLYVSYGQNTGSYVERVYRSESPNGGFYDATGISALDNTTYDTHGTQILSPFNSSSNDYIYVSTGHSSVYAATNADGDRVNVNSVHARPLASEDNGWVALEDGALATRQVDLSGNVSLQNAIGYTEDGWPLLMAYSYNGTDSFTTDVTMYDLEGIYMSNDMQLTVTYSYSEEYRMTLLAVDDTTAIMYGKTSTGVSFRNPVVLEKGDNGVNYITIYTDDDLTEVFARGVLMSQVENGETRYCYSIINEYEASDDYGMVSWCYRSGDLPETDLESNGDSVSTSGVIYTHLENGDYTLYGQEISDNYTYGQSGSTGERFTQITLNYPNYIDTSDDGSIYSLFDQERCLEEGSTYTGGSYIANDMHNGYWYDSETGDLYTDAEAMVADADVQARLVHEYYLTGYVSNYFCYNEDTGSYTESGVEFAITYYSLDDDVTYGEYEFLYVLPNPAWAHSVAATRNQSSSRKNSNASYVRFAESVGTSTELSSTLINQANGTFNSESSALGDPSEGYGTGNYAYINDFGINEDSLATYASPATLAAQFNDYDSSEGTSSGAFYAYEHTDDDEVAYAVATNVVEADYYIDYSDTENSLITYDSNGTPTGYQFEMYASNILWANGPTIPGVSSVATSSIDGITSITYTSSETSDNILETNASFEYDYLGSWSSQDVTVTGASDLIFRYRDDAETVQALFTDDDGNINTAFPTYDNGKSDTATWSGTATFTGKGSVAKNTDTTSAETYANYILELGTYNLVSGAGYWLLGEENYHYYNIGVNTCDKGAVRYFANTCINKVIDIETDEDGNIVSWTATDDDLDSGDYTVASYTAYLEAIAEAFWFYENTYNTTYTDDDGNTCEYTVAYDSDGIPYSDTETVSSDIFGTGTTSTDPVQAQIIENIIEAYNNLMSITEYEEAEETYTTAYSLLTDLVGDYTADSLAAYNELLANVADYFGYDTSSDAKNTENYWRYTTLDTEEYEEVIAYIEAIKANLMPVVTVDTALATAVTDGDTVTAYTAEDGDGTALGTALTKQNTGIFDTDETTQIYSYASWYAIYQEILTAQGYLDDAVDSEGHEANMYNYDETTSTIEVLGETYEYSTWTEDESNYSALQIALNAEAAVLNALDLESVDEADCYNTFDTVVTLYENMDRNKYTDEALALIDALVTQLTTGISSDTITNCEDSSISYFADTYVYAQDSTFVEAYNTIMSTSLDTDYQFKMTALYETDTITAMLLSLLSTEDYYNWYTATFTVMVDGEQVGDTTVTDTYYGYTFYFDAASVLSANGYDDYTVANWSATLYDGTSDDYDSTSGQFTSDTTASHKISSFENTDWAKIADSNVAVAVNFTDNTAHDDSVRVEVYNVYHVLSEIYYVDAADAPTEGTNTSQSLTVGEYTITAADIPFYSFANWSIDIDDETGYYTLKPNYSATPTSLISVQDGGTISGDVTETETANTYQATYDATVTVDGSGITDFYAWAIDNGDGTYVVASYESNYSFYVVADEDFVVITYSSADGYCIDGTEITADMIPYGLPENVDDNGEIAGMTEDEFIAYKLENKLPFIAIEYVGFPSTTKVRCYVRVTTGASGTTGYGVVCDYTGATSTEEELISGTTGVRTFTVDSLLDSGQFVVTLNKSSGFSTDVAFRAYVTYDFDYSYIGYVDGSSATTTYSGSISAVEYSAKAVAEV